jgi:hypothetical protein
MILTISILLKDAFQMVYFSFQTFHVKALWHVGLVSLVQPGFVLDGARIWHLGTVPHVILQSKTHFQLWKTWG